MAYNPDFNKLVQGTAKNSAVAKSNSTTKPAPVDVSGIKLKDGPTTTIKTSKGNIHLKDALKKIIYGVALVGTTVGLAATGFGAANIIAIAVNPIYNLISFETLSWGIMTGVGYKLTKATLGTTMRNTPALKPIYDAVTGAKDELGIKGEEKKGSKK